MDGTTVVIDLGTDRGVPPADAGPDPRRLFTGRRLRAMALALAGVLLLGTAADARPRPRTWEILHTSVGFVGMHELTADRLFVAGPTRHDRPGTVVAYDLDRKRELWTSQIGIERLLALTAAAGVVLVMDGDWSRGPVRTTALDARTGRWRWSLPHQVLTPAGERTAVILDETFRPGSEVDADDPPPATADLYQSRSGAVYRMPPIGVTARGIALDRGRTTWTSPLLARALVVPAADGWPAVVLAERTDGGIELRDVSTGVVRQRLDRSGGPVRNAYRFGDALLVWHADGKLTRYAGDPLRREWTRSLPVAEGAVDRCGPMLCLYSDRAVRALDPATAAVAWEQEQMLLIGSGDRLIEADGAPRVRRVRDAHTGRTVLDLTGWAEAVQFEDEPPLLLRGRAGGTQTWLGLLSTDGTEVRPLDPVPHHLSSCQLVPGLFACRSQRGDIHVWRYRPDGGAGPAGSAD